MTDAQLMEFVSKIDRFDYSHGNFVRVYFKHPKDIDWLKQSFAELGVTDIIQAKSSILSGTTTDEYMFELNYRGSAQKKIIDNLEQKSERMKAWLTLRGWGGLQETPEEKAYLKHLEDMERAAANLKSKGK